MMETKEIVKALICCYCHNLDDCEDCEYNKLRGFCVDSLKRDAVQRLEKLEAEIAKLKKQLSEKHPEWISVEDRLPEENGTFIIAVKGSYCSHFAGFDVEANEFCKNVFRKKDITHWMPLPEPPKPKVLTFRDVFLEKFPNAPLRNDGDPKACLAVIFAGGAKIACDDCNDCWNQLYFEEEDEADA